MGVPEATIHKLDPFFGRKASDAYEFALKHKNDPPPLTQKELDQLNRAVMMSNFNDAGKAYSNASPIANFSELPWQAQTAIADLWYNRGDLRVVAPAFWDQVTTGRWQAAVNNLEKLKTSDKRLNDRAKADAEILRQALEAKLLPKP